jgi:uncharacterized membrane protein
MAETLQFLKAHLTDNFAVYFILLYTFGGRPGAILAAMAVGVSVYLVVPVVVLLDTFQIPVFYFLYGAVGKQAVVRRLAERSKRKMALLRESAFLRRFQVLGPAGVVAITMLPLKGCGMWTGVLMSKLLGLPLPRSYALLITGSLLGCALLVGAGEALLQVLH